MKHLVHLNSINRYIVGIVYLYIILFCLQTQSLNVGTKTRVIVIHFFFSFIYAANSGKDCEKELGLRQEIAVGVEIVGGTGRSVSDSDRQDYVHQ